MSTQRDFDMMAIAIQNTPNEGGRVGGLQSLKRIEALLKQRTEADERRDEILLRHQTCEGRILAAEARARRYEEALRYYADVLHANGSSGDVARAALEGGED